MSKTYTSIELLKKFAPAFYEKYDIEDILAINDRFASDADIAIGEKVADKEYSIAQKHDLTWDLDKRVWKSNK